MFAREIALLLWTGCLGTQMNNCHENLNTCFTRFDGIHLNKILVAMENFEICTVAMLGGPCWQRVTGNTSRLNQPQSAITDHRPNGTAGLARANIAGQNGGSISVFAGRGEDNDLPSLSIHNRMVWI